MFRRLAHVKEEGSPLGVDHGHPNFLELRQGEVRLSPGRMGQDFSGSCAVASRNPLIHEGATNTT